MKRESLVDMSIQYFRRRGFEVRKEKSSEFDFMIRNKREQHPVWVKEWNRTVGVNIVIRLDNKSQEGGLPDPIVVADHFSAHAKAYAKRRGLELITRLEMQKRLR